MLLLAADSFCAFLPVLDFATSARLAKPFRASLEVRAERGVSCATELIVVFYASSLPVRCDPGDSGSGACRVEHSLRLSLLSSADELLSES